MTLIILLVVLAVIALAVIGIYNGLVRLNVQATNAWSDIDVQLKRRTDLIPNVIETVKGYAAHERQTLESVINARNRAVAAQSAGPAERSQAEGALTTALRGLFALAESYPQLRAVESFTQLQGTLAQIEDAMADFGADATGTRERLAQFHRVENTYLSTFQALGGLGLILGTIGLATVLLRNVLERRRELALLGAVGFRSQHVLTMVVAENVLLLGCGLLAGAICAGLAIAPAVVERGGRFPITSSGALILFAVFITGLLSSIVAMNAATRAPLLSSLRSE